METRKALGKGMGALFSDAMSDESEKKSHESEVITHESEAKIQKEEVITPESAVNINESEVISQDSEVITHEPEAKAQESRVKTKKSKGRGKESVVRSKESKVKTNESKVMTIDPEMLEQAIAEGFDSPRVSLWSPLVMSALRYLSLTTVRFSMSHEASTTLEDAFREKYPELCQRIEEEMEGA